MAGAILFRLEHPPNPVNVALEEVPHPAPDLLNRFCRALLRHRNASPPLFLELVVPVCSFPDAQVIVMGLRYMDWSRHVVLLDLNSRIPDMGVRHRQFRLLVLHGKIISLI